MKVYFDNAATTELREEVIDCMTRVLKNEYGNPSSTHSFGRASKSLIEKARKDIAGLLNVSASEIIFTSGGTEADNLILISAVRDLGVERIISTPVEHHAVLHTLGWLRQEKGIEVTDVKLDSCGHVDFDDLEKLLEDSSKKTLVSLMHINNEVGNMLDLKRAAVLCRDKNVLFHSDTVQSVGHYDLDFQEIPLDFAAASAHKFHGPKGVGFAFIRKNSGLKPLIHGGSQEKGLRAGTESVSGIAGMAEALKISCERMAEESKQIGALKKYFRTRLEESLPGVKFNGACGDDARSTYTLLNVCLPLSEAQAMMLLFQLDLKGIACSKGSACQSGSNSGSHVLKAILSEEDFKKPSVRFSFSHFNTREEADYVVNVLQEFVKNPVVTK